MLQKTLVIIKPDGVQRNLVGEIIRRFEEARLKVTKLQMLTASTDLISKHYPEDEEYMRSIGKKAADSGEKVTDPLEYGRQIIYGLRTYITQGPVIAMVLEGEDAVALVRQVTGFTDPSKAEKGTIRGDLGEDSFSQANNEKRPTRNLVHASGNLEEAGREISLWFGNCRKS